MPTAKGIYTGALRTRNQHLQSGQELVTDAPTDNQGLGEAFSPTDLLATSYATCMITIMGIKARDKGLNLDGTTYQITKVMYADPRRVGEIHVALTIPDRNFTNRDRKVLEAIAHTCPVALSIHPEIKKVVVFNWQ